MEQNAHNAMGMKLQNKRNIMDSLRIRPHSRAELARQTGLTRAAISVIIDNLLKEGLLVEGEPILGKVGRKSFRIDLNPERYHIIGVTLERDCCRVGAAGFDGRLLRIERLDDAIRKCTAEQILGILSDLIDRFEGEYELGGELLGIGVTAPGPLDLNKGRILNPPDFEKWENCCAVGYFRERFAAPVILENDVNALAAAERYYGVGRQYENYLELHLDTGVGGGIILGGELYRGRAGLGGQIGHMTIDVHGERCICGNIGCAELYASIPRIVRRGAERNPGFSSWRRIVSLASGGDGEALRLLSRMAEYLAAVIVNVVNLLELDAVILGGEATYKGELLGRMTEDMVNDRFMGRRVQRIPVVLSQMPEEGQMVAACNLILESYVKNMV